MRAKKDVMTEYYWHRALSPFADLAFGDLARSVEQRKRRKEKTHIKTTKEGEVILLDGKGYRLYWNGDDLVPIHKLPPPKCSKCGARLSDYTDGVHYGQKYEEKL